MKGMQKIQRGVIFQSLVDYLYARESKDKDRGVLIGGNMSAQEPKSLAKEFLVSRALRPDIEKPVWHNALRLPKGEKLSNEKWNEIADDYMQRMGFSDMHQRCYWLHDDEDGQHVHIAASRIGLDGSVYLGRNENLESTKVIAQLEEEYGLQPTPKRQEYEDKDGNRRVSMPDKRKPTKNEIEQAVRTGQEPPRQRLQRLVEEAMQGKPTSVQFAERLEAVGVTPIANLATTGRMSGFSFAIDGVEFKGSQLGDMYKWSRLSEEVSYEQDRDSAQLERYSARVRRRQNAEGDTRPSQESRPTSTGAAVDAVDGQASESTYGHASGENGTISASGGDTDRRGASIAEQTKQAVERGNKGATAGGGQNKASNRSVPQGIESLEGRDRAVEIDEAGISVTPDLDVEPSNVGAYDRLTAITSLNTPAQRAKYHAWREQHDALRAEHYRITLTARADGLNSWNFGKGKGEGDTERFYSPKEVADLIPTLSRQNARGYDIYITPIDDHRHYFLVDDMTPDSLKKLEGVGYTPSIVQESSRDNLQAVLIADKSDKSYERDLANKIARQLNKTWGDPECNGVIHPFRMAGFVNKKQGRDSFITRIVKKGHQQCSRLLNALVTARQNRQNQIDITARRKAEENAKHSARRAAESAQRNAHNEFVNSTLDRFAVIKGEELRRVKAAGWTLDESRVDFAIAKRLVREMDEGLAVELIRDHGLSMTSRDHSNPHQYAVTTVRNAINANARDEVESEVDRQYEREQERYNNRYNELKEKQKRQELMYRRGEGERGSLVGMSDSELRKQAEQGSKRSAAYPVSSYEKEGSTSNISVSRPRGG